MIRLETISISDFRGIKEIQLNLAQENFGIFGPNGTGKSGVVDAIEFGLTGSITRLTGVGSDELSVGKHGPHVDTTEKPEKAKVVISGVLTSTGQKIKIERNVKHPSKPKFTPDDEQVKTAVREIERHPELALSRRDIVKYIVTPAGKRDQDVKTLLRLDRLETIRKSLIKVSNEKATNAKSLRTTAEQEKESLVSGLGLDRWNKDEILEQINILRSTLSLPKIDKLKSNTNIKVGLKDGGVKKSSIPKELALKETRELYEAVEKEEKNIVTARETAFRLLETLLSDTKVWKLTRQKKLVEIGLELVDDNNCPLCDTDWGEDALRSFLEEKLGATSEVSDKLEKISDATNVLSADIKKLLAKYSTAIHRMNLVELEKETRIVEDEISRLETVLERLHSCVDSEHDLSACKSVLAKSHNIGSKVLKAAIRTLLEAIEKQPNVSEADKAEEQLILAQERFTKWIFAAKAAKSASGHEKTAKKVKDVFLDQCASELNHIYEQVETDFANYYKLLNQGDEDNFEGNLTPEPSKLNMDVDFYGRGKFPPGAYHSEGHQDSMGLCLYLALMKQTMGKKFCFCVLDDVLMSVDTGHRRQVCHLLQKEFPDTQFILTTHDRVWLNFMRSEKLISQSITFGGWSVDTGPLVFEDVDMMQRIRLALNEGDIQTAAGRLRHYLEHMGHFLCDGLRASVPFRGDSQYTLSDTLPSALSSIRKRLKESKSAAASWKKDDLKQEIEKMQSTFEEAVAKSKTLEWGINPAVHYNQWENFEPKEFEEIVNAFDSLLKLVRCDVCNSYFRITYSGSSPQSLNCVCGEIRMELKKKKSAVPSTLPESEKEKAEQV